MRRDDRTLLVVALAVVGALALAYGAWRWREAGRARLLGVRVVTASDRDPVFRDGARQIAPGEGFQLAVALHLAQRGRGDYWVCPAPELVMHGASVAHDVSDHWPEKDRLVRVFWSTIESNFLGGEITAQSAAKRLVYRPFLAPRLGRAMLATGVLEAHNDDYIADAGEYVPDHTGTLRFYARVELVTALSDVKPLAAASSLGPDHLWDPDLPMVSRVLAGTGAIRPVVGTLFLLPGFEPMPARGAAWNDVTSGGLDHDFTSLVSQRLVASSWTFAAVAVAGDPGLDPATLTPLGEVRLGERGLLRAGRPLAWGKDVRAGDLLTAAGHWIVLESDDGDGVLGLADTVLQCWRRPPQQLPLLAALDHGTRSLRLLRHAPSD